MPMPPLSLQQQPLPEGKGSPPPTYSPPPLAATCCRVGLHASCTGVGVMLNLVITRPLTEGAGKSHSQKTQQQKMEKKRRKTYREVSGMTLKTRPDIDGPAGQGLLPGCDPRPLTLAGGGVVPTGSCPAYRSPRPSARDFPTEAVGEASSGYDSATHGRQSAPRSAQLARPHLR